MTSDSSVTLSKRKIAPPETRPEEGLGLPIPAEDNSPEKARIVQTYEAVGGHHGRIEVWEMLGGFVRIATEVESPESVVRSAFSMDTREGHNSGVFVSPHNGLFNYEHARPATPEEIAVLGPQLRLETIGGVKYVQYNSNKNKGLLGAKEIRELLVSQGWTYFEPAISLEDPRTLQRGLADTLKACQFGQFGLTRVASRKIPLGSLVQILERGVPPLTVQANELRDVRTAVGEKAEEAIYCRREEEYSDRGNLMLVKVPHEEGDLRLVLRDIRGFIDPIRRVSNDPQAPLLREVYFHVPFGFPGKVEHPSGLWYEVSLGQEVPSWFNDTMKERVHDLSRELAKVIRGKEHNRVELQEHETGIIGCVRSRNPYQKYEAGNTLLTTQQTIDQAVALRSNIRQAVALEHKEYGEAQKAVYDSRRQALRLPAPAR